MNPSYYDEHTDSTDKVTNGPINSDVFADRTPVDPALIHETAMGGTVAAIEPVDEPVADEVPMYETPEQEIPMGGTVAAVGPMAETAASVIPLPGPGADEEPMAETPARPTPMSWTAAAVRPLNTELRSETTPLYGTPVQTHPMNSEMVADAIPMYETPVKEISLIETAPLIAAVPYKAPVSETIPYTAPVTATATPLLNGVESEHFRIHWNEIQGKFVDDPRTAVLQADALVDEVIAEVAQTFAKERSSLESKWKQNNDVSTEDLRKALQLYRSFFNRLVV
jgi:hypothetical protein